MASVGSLMPYPKGLYSSWICNRICRDDEGQWNIKHKQWEPKVASHEGNGTGTSISGERQGLQDGVGFLDGMLEDEALPNPPAEGRVWAGLFEGNKYAAKSETFKNIGKPSEGMKPRWGDGNRKGDNINILDPT
ncbi:hypothetical protein HAX54_030080 [Datura stramonium]|uniref:Uncharacterized protein n=1 Tax=Datura stramonium TaxID=4076 RepID=A0ABS8V9D5_DATST|nr:hypothetical protein [Datura stramonium]